MFEYPNYLKKYLQSKNKPPMADFVNGSTYYSELD